VQHKREADVCRLRLTVRPSLDRFRVHDLW
jgi:hypothetical protein